MSYWNFKNRYQNLGTPETIVQELITGQYTARDGSSKPMTRYQIAKQTGLSWHTINKALVHSGAAYSSKTKKRIQQLMQY